MQDLNTRMHKSRNAVTRKNLFYSCAVMILLFINPNLSFAIDLIFLEDWNSGGFNTPGWSADSGWSIILSQGNPIPCAEFSTEEALSNYNYVLESDTLDATYFTEGKIYLDINIRLGCLQNTGNEILYVELWSDLTNEWHFIRSYNNSNGSYDWMVEEMTLHWAMSSHFKIRFRATGVSSSILSYWQIDNIKIYRKCNAPIMPPLVTDDYCQVFFDPNQPPPIDESIQWDDSTFSSVFGHTGTFDVAAKWDTYAISEYENCYIEQVSFIPLSLNAQYRIRIWSGENAQVLMADQAVESVVASEWNIVYLNPPVLLDITEDLWIGINVVSSLPFPVIGCDDGPAVDGFGNMIRTDTWHSLLEIQPDADVNFNISAQLVESPFRPFIEFFIYRKFGDDNYEFWCEVIPWIFPPCFPDWIPPGVLACYKMTAWYGSEIDLCESNYSNEQCVICTTGLPEHNSLDDLAIFPNPANQKFTVKFNIHSKTYITLKINDILGHCCRTIEDKVLPPGTYEFDCPVTGLLPGVYYCTLSTERTKKVKMLIINNSFKGKE